MNYPVLRNFFQAITLFLLLCLPLAKFQAQTQNSRPNIIVILADDLGYGDVGFNRNASYPAELGIIPTPHLDALAGQGIIATNAHVAHPFCGPSRAAIMSGRYPHRIGAQYNLPSDITSTLGITEAETYFPELIDQTSYNSMAIGKWHLGFTEGSYQPQDRGFDEFFGFLGGGKNYFRSNYDGVWYKYRPSQPEYNDPALYNEPKDNHTTNVYQNPLRRNRNYVDRKEFAEDAYLTDVLTDQSIDFIERKAGEPDPFFMYIAYNAPHTPLQAPQVEIDAFKIANPQFENLVRNSDYLAQSNAVQNLPETDRAAKLDELTEDRIVYATMVANMDANIGRIVAKLDAKGALDNTLIIFFSDNGGATISKGAVNYPLDAQKGSVDEGGHRVPFLVHWPEKITTAATYDFPLSALDLYPTLVDVAGGEVPSGKELDGVSFMDKMIAGEDARPGEPLYALRPQNGFHNAAVISYPYRMSKKGGNGNWRLYDARVNPEVEVTGPVDVSTAADIKLALEAKGAQWSREFFEAKPGWFDHDRNDGHPHRILWFGEDLAGNTQEPVFADYDVTFSYDLHPNPNAVYPHTDPLNTRGWTLKADMSDEFEGDTLDENKWLIQGRDGEFRSRFVGRAPWQYSPDNVRLEDGMLKIETRHEPDYDWINPGDDEYRWTTAGISTKNTLFKGYMEIKCRLPVEFVTGAFWTTGSPGVGSELDIFEAVGKGNRDDLMWSTLHDWTIPRPNKVWTDTKPLPFTFSDDFHTYSAEWSQDSVKFFADGELIHSVTRQWVEQNGVDSKRWPLEGGQHLWVDSEIFPWWGEPDSLNLPVDYEVEYVRVWEREDDSNNDFTTNYDFEGPILLPDGSFGNWFIPAASQNFYSIGSENVFDGENALKFTHDGILPNNAVAFAPFGSLQLDSGNHVMRLQIWVEEGSTETRIRPILENPWVELPSIEVAGLPTGQWNILDLPFHRPEASADNDRLRLLLRPNDTDDGTSTVFMDNIEFDPEPMTVVVSGLNVSPESAIIAVDDSLALRAVTLPTHASNQNVTWSSSDENIATVSANGMVFPAGLGTVTVVATTEDGGFTASSTIEVRMTVSANYDRTPVDPAIVSPNPFTDKLTVDLKKAGQFTHLEIFDLTGKIIFQRTINPSDLGFDIFLGQRSAPRSTYLLRLRGPNYTQIIPVVYMGTR